MSFTTEIKIGVGGGRLGGGIVKGRGRLQVEGGGVEEEMTRPISSLGHRNGGSSFPLEHIIDSN